MIITARPWRDLPDGSLIISPSGRVWRIDSRDGHVFELRDPETGAGHTLTGIDPNSFTSAILPTTQPDEQHALAVLSHHFRLEPIPS